MKKLFLLLAACAPFFLHAQTEDTGARRVEHQVGFDATGFIKQFIVFNNTAPTNMNPFSYNYKALWRSADGMAYMGPRVGIGFTNDQESTHPDENTDRTITSSSIAARIGFERQHVITKSWHLYYGVDIMYATAYDKAETVFKSHPAAPDGFTTLTRDMAETRGAGPIMGIQFNINKRLCLSTESSFFYTETTSRFKSESTFPGAKNDPEDVTKLKSARFILPTFINFNIKL
jgi:hypothetical protein